MIGSLTGTVTEKAPPRLLLEVSGIGYDVQVPMSTFFSLPALGERVRLLIHPVVREDAHLLYGFLTEPERSLFRSVLKVSGVGPRIALALLSGITIDAFTQVVREKDSSALTRIPGIGRKIAERLLVEMQDRLDALTPSGDSVVGSGVEAEATRALLALDYKPAEAARLIKAASTGTQSTEELIRSALQIAGKE